VARVFWTDRARDRFDLLPEIVQNLINQHLVFVEQWPEMDPEVMDPPHWRGHRKFLVRRQWLVLYRVKKGASPDQDQVYVAEIVPARSNY